MKRRISKRKKASRAALEPAGGWAAPLSEPGRRRSREQLARSHHHPHSSAAPPAPPEGEVSRVSLVEVEPSSLFVHWEVREDALAAARRRLRDPEAKIVLRFQSAGAGPGTEQYDVEIAGPRGTLFLSPRGAARHLRSSLGVRSGSGQFATLARSNVAEIPPAAESDRYEERFREVRGSSGAAAARRPAATALVEEVPGVPAAEAVVDLWIGSEEEPPSGGGPGGVPPDQHWRAPAEAAASLAAPPFEARYEPCPPPRGQAWPQPHAPKNGDLPSHGVGEETAIGVSSPAVAFAGYEQPTSFAGPPPHDQVTLDLRAEVVIYGRTRPGTAVFLSGARIPVGADGTFEARFALPPAPSRAGGERTDSKG